MNTRRADRIVLLMLLLFLGCSKGSKQEVKESSTGAVVPVEVSVIRQGDLNESVEAVGQVEARRKEAIFSPVAGTVVSFRVTEGTAVRAGDVLAQIQTRESQAAISGAEALLEAASTPELKQEAERALELAKSNQHLVTIATKSPGVVSARNVVEGSLVAEGAELMTIIDPESVDFVALVTIKHLGTVKLEEKGSVNLTQARGATYEARVSAISPQSDPQTQTTRVRMQFVNIPAAQRVYLRDGIPGTARIVTGVRKNALLVPVQALLRNDANDTYTVVTVTKDSLSLSVPVTVGVLADYTAEIISPSLQAGMNVVVVGNYALAD